MRQEQDKRRLRVFADSRKGERRESVDIDRRSTLLERRAENRSDREKVSGRSEKTNTMGFDPEKGEQNSEWQQQQPHYPVVDQSPAYYGTFQGQQGFPQPVPPSQAPHYVQDGAYVPHSVRDIHGRIVQGQPLLGGEHFERVDPLPFCGLGFGWFLFIFGFFCIIPWYIGVFIYFCLAHDTREKAGLLACTIAAILCLLAGGTRFSEIW